jgi:hypothetical protein
MTISNLTSSASNPRTRALLAIARRYIGGRRGLLLLAGLALAFGLAFRWNWLVAAGIAPFVLGLLPCAVMCAVGVGCAYKLVGSAKPTEPKQPVAEVKLDSTPETKS